MKPIIGITLCYDKGELINKGVNYSYIRREYGDAVKLAGGEPIFLDLSIDPVTAVRLCDGLVISGGEDINPGEYGSEITFAQKLEPVERTHWERQVINECDKKGIPIFGVCYGSQLLNVHYGGTLYQDIYEELGTTQDHGSKEHQVEHTITFLDDFLGFKKGGVATVASRHHQAIHDVAPGMRVIATAPDGVIEAIAGHGHCGVQWHAESDATSAGLYSAFVAKCAQVAQAHQAAVEIEA